MFVPGTVAVNGRRVKYSLLSDSPSIPRFIDTKIIASGQDLSQFTFTKPSTTIKRG